MIYYPNNIEVCAHRFGKKMTYTEQTDTLAFGTSYSQFMALAKARGIKVGAFVRYSELSASEISQAINEEHSGNLWLDQYDECPSLATKLNNREQISQEEFVYAYTNELLPTFQNVVGRKPIAMSYRNGVDNFKDYVLPYYLCARNSVPSGNTIYNTFPTDYGIGYGNPNDEPYSITRYKSKASSMRWYDAAIEQGDNFTEQLIIVAQKIDETMLNGGWLNNFTHWHNYWQQGNEQWAEAYLDLLASKNANKEIYFAGYGEAVAYMVYRQLVTEIQMYSPTSNSYNVMINIETNNEIGVDTSLLQIPLSVKINTTGTPLDNKEIESNQTLISLGNNQYILEVPYSERHNILIKNKEFKIMNCLVTKLKANVSNPNLPVFEQMQQFTLDAITASGNSSMTDAQKWALNHFFYEMGAIEDNSLWGKVRTLFLPIIGVGKSTIVKDYKTPGIKINEGSHIVDQAGALQTDLSSGLTVIETNLQNITTNLKNSALLIMSSADRLFIHNEMQLAIGTTTYNKYRTFGNTTGIFDVDINVSGSRTTVRFEEENLSVILGNYTTDKLSAFGVYSGNIVNSSASMYGADYGSLDGSIENANYVVKLYPSTKLGLIIDFNASLTDAECLKVINAANDLRNAFMTE